MTQRNLLTLGELKAALATTPKRGGVVVLRGTEIPWLPVTMGQYSDHLAGDPSVQAFYVFGTEVAISREEPGFEPDGKAFQAATAATALRAAAAFLACSFGHPGNQELIGWIMECPPEELDAALDTVEYGSWGDDPERFFGGVAKLTQSRPMKAMVRAARRQTETRSSEQAETPTSTPTASRARTSPTRRSKPTKPKRRTR